MIPIATQERPLTALSSSLCKCHGPQFKVRDHCTKCIPWRSTDKRHSEIGMWEEFQHVLKGEFYPEFVEEEARAKLQWLAQRGTEVEQGGVQELSKAMTVAESVVKLGLGKDKLQSSNFEGRGVCEGNHKEDNGSGNDNDGGNWKQRVGKKKPNKKRGKLKCFLCDGTHLSKKCLKKSVFSNKEKPEGKDSRLGSSTWGVKSNEAKSKKKLVECFLCHGLHRLQKCQRKSIIKGDDASNKEPKKLGSSKGKFEAKREKRSKKKRVKCFLHCGPHEL
ncbi:hypothetical protein Gogos_020949 [Gossypium gossypioides]|uniref:Uncharacterized protein n=1 Tax=Gossypium gossypioides TaxID=34282 RepID=A0A7J9D659_GOSGO|nr:hypothetical protein [Gossypium gossypioides]